MASIAESFRSTPRSERRAPECSTQCGPAATPHVRASISIHAFLSALYELSFDQTHRRKRFLPETDTVDADRVALRLQEELYWMTAKHGSCFDITVHNLEDIVKSLFPEKERGGSRFHSLRCAVIGLGGNGIPLHSIRAPAVSNPSV
jgi:hypothetical protein